MSILKAIGRGCAKPDVIKEMLDLKSNTKVIYSHDDPEGLMLYDCEYESVAFNSGNKSIRNQLSIWAAQIIQKKILEIKIMSGVIHKNKALFTPPDDSFHKHEPPKSFKRIKETTNNYISKSTQ